MMKRLFILILILSIGNLHSQTSAFNDLLQNHVNEKGDVDYKAFKKDEAKLDTYLASLEKTNTTSFASDNTEMAFWINVYNAYTIKIILSNYPLKSITNIKEDGKTAWKIPFVKAGGKTYTLDYVEHEILRKKFKDPRIHVGVNCASGSCPKLANFAFTAENVDSALESLMKDFVNDTTRNKLKKNSVQISEIFNWFKGDFTTNGSVIDYLNRYSNVAISKKAKIKYLPYDWSLNSK
ncbi:DUF547 domain-containing protein [Flavobacteriaceae bacterium S356]|uniref:DUF547 domain-containing protein n=1 Tax=Asprobacillus argus TaxID=3076534 RepID=A0ABU3LB46_9FLAO|nr:DUF547 domain-containing protein [Flavobacteriaceae bacterium S356]